MKLSGVIKGIQKLFSRKYCTAVIVAAGSASRMGGIDKVMAPLKGEPMILRTVRAFQESAAIQEIVIVTREDLLVAVMDLCHGFSKVKTVVAGGATRQESVELGLAAASGKTRLVAIHDGARPLISVDLIEKTVKSGETFGAAAPGVPVKDTIKEVTGGIVVNTPDRSALQGVQTPQVFDIDLLKGALNQAKKDNAQVTDDCSAVERLGMSVYLVQGEEKNIKVTTPMDLKIAELLLEDEV